METIPRNNKDNNINIINFRYNKNYQQNCQDMDL